MNSIQASPRISIKHCGVRHDKQIVSLFAQHAAELLESASLALTAGFGVSDTTILVGRDGGIRVLDGAGWPLDSLQAEYGTAAAYRISSGRGGLRVEGRAGSTSCVLRSTPP